METVKSGKKVYSTQYEKMTEMPVGKLILQLGIPTTLTMLVTNIYNMADTFFVGQINNSASGAVGVVFGIMAILQAVGFMFGHGAGSMVSRFLGSHEEGRANRVATVALFCSFTFGLAISVIGLSFLDPILYLMGSTDTILPYARDYATCILLAAPFMVTSFSLNNLLRYQGKAVLALVGIGFGGILNIALDPILMFGFEMGTLGAGVATAISQLISFTILCCLYQSKLTVCKFKLSEIKYTLTEMWMIMSTGMPSFIRQGLGSISTMLLNGQAKLYGDPAVAAMSVVGKITMFVFCVGLGIGQGFQPVAGFNYGAKKYDRVRKGFFFTFVTGEILLGIVALGGIAVSDFIVGVFRDDPTVIEIGSKALLYQLIAVLFMPFTVCTNMMLQSTGKNVQASITALLKNGLCFIPLILTLPLRFGVLGIQIAQPIADLITFLCSIPFAIHFFVDLRKRERALTEGGDTGEFVYKETVDD